MKKLIIIILTIVLCPIASAQYSTMYLVNENGNVGIGTSNASSPLTLTAQSSTRAPISGTTMHVVGLNDNPLRITLDTHSNSSTSGSAIFGRRSRGTAAIPSAINADDTLLYLSGYGYGATGYSTVGHGSIALSAAEDWDDSNQGTFWRIYTTGLGATTQTERLRIEANGNVGIGSVNPIAKLDVDGAIRTTSTITASNISGTTSGTNTGDQTTITGNAGTATALAANGGNCSGNEFAVGVNASGVGECVQPAFSNLTGSATDAQIPDNITITETDPQVGTLTNTKWCTTDGTDIDCTSDAPSGSGAPTTVDYLVGTADAGLSAEIVVGTSPGGELGNTWASPTIDDNVAVSSWDLTAPDIQAGSASADSWPTFASGTVMTTAEDGALEADADAFYLTTDAGNRGYVPAVHIIRADATRTFTSNTSQQAIFNSPSNGRLTLETGTYLFNCLVAMDTQSATSGNGKFAINSGGTATLGSMLWHGWGQDLANEATGAATGGSWHSIAIQTGTNLTTAATGAAHAFQIKGTFEVTGAGTIIPSYAQTTAAAAVVKIGSYCAFERVGSTTMTSVGQWD